jgi:DNA repair exonuclease SbcCD ATPase subunit
MKLDKAQTERKAEIISRWREAQENLAREVETFNEKMRDAFRDVETARDEYNSALADALSFAEDVATDAQEYFDNKSEKWQESDKGAAHTDWMDTLSNFGAEECNLDTPDDLEAPSDDDVSLFEELPEASES